MLTQLPITSNETQKHIFMNALSHVGLTEVVGVKHNPLIIQWGKKIASWFSDDETSWCSVFMNAMCDKAGIKGTGKLDARSWLKWGKEIKEPEVGCMVIYWRVSPTSWQGHIGMVVSIHDNVIETLGGNQSNKVGVQAYPKERVLGYRVAAQ